MKSVFIVLVVMLAASSALAEDREPCQDDKMCYPKTQVEKWNKAIQERKNKPAPAPVIVEKEVIKSAPKNSLSLIAGRTETNLEASGAYPTLKANTAGQFDIGLMYQRSLGKNWRASAIGTKNGSFYGGIGYDFNLFGE